VAKAAGPKLVGVEVGWQGIAAGRAVGVEAVVASPLAKSGPLAHRIDYAVVALAETLGTGRDILFQQIAAGGELCR